MKPKEKREWISIIISCIAGLILFLILYLYLKWKLLLSMGLAAVFYLALSILLKPSERIGKIDVAQFNNGEYLYEKLTDAGTDYDRIFKAVGKIKDRSLQQECVELLETSEKILYYLKDHPEKIPQARRYINYYQETAANVMEHYVELQDTGMKVNMKTKENMEEAIQVLQKAFQIQFEKMVQNEVLDMEIDLQVLKRTLQSEGYEEKGGNEFL